jgi:hypothetical protein
MDLLLIGIVILVGIILIEVSKHLFTRTILRFVVMIIVGLVIFFAVVGTLDSDIVDKTNNEYVQTGAAIVDNIADEPLMIEAKEKIKSFFIEIKEKIKNQIN